MTTDYNQIASQYRKAKEQPWRTQIELFSMMNQIGDLEGLRFVDLACGEGFLTRQIRLAGALKVVGVDISEQMIALANAYEASAPLGISYVTEDARESVQQQSFDLAVSGWLLVYAHNREEIASMCQGMAQRLKRGGRFVTLTTNPALYSMQSRPPDYRAYGFEVQLPESAYEGAPLIWNIHLDDSSFEIENYYLSIETHLSAFEDAGFRDISVHELTLSPDPEAGDEGTHWEEILNYSPAIIIEGFKI